MKKAADSGPFTGADRNAKARAKKKADEPEQEDERHGKQPYGDIHGKDAPPAEKAGQDPAKERPHRKPEIHGSSIDPQGFSPLFGGGHGSEDGNRSAEDHRASEPLQDPQQDDCKGGWREDHQERCECEYRKPGSKYFLTPINVRDPAEGDPQFPQSVPQRARVHRKVRRRSRGERDRGVIRAIGHGVFTQRMCRGDYTGDAPGRQTALDRWPGQIMASTGG